MATSNLSGLRSHWFEWTWESTGGSSLPKQTLSCHSHSPTLAPPRHHEARCVPECAGMTGSHVVA